MREAEVADLSGLIAALRRRVTARARLYLVARTSHLAERWCERVPRLVLAADPGAPGALHQAVREICASLGLHLVWESPADVIPLPVGWEQRSRAVRPAVGGTDGALEVRHFDPYSVILRLIARGDEPDYIEALEYVRRGWVDFPRLEGLVGDVLPRFTNATLAQDPAEFRRKFRGLRQVCAGHAVPLGPEQRPMLAEAVWP